MAARVSKQIPRDAVDITDISRNLGVGYHTVYGWIRRDIGFPKPAVVINRRPVWSMAAVRAWHRRWVKDHKGDGRVPQERSA